MESQDKIVVSLPPLPMDDVILYLANSRSGIPSKKINNYSKNVGFDIYKETIRVK